MSNWISIFETDQLYLAELTVGILHDHGIDAVIFNQKDSSYTTFGEIRVMVNEEEASNAQEIINSIHRE